MDTLGPNDLKLPIDLVAEMEAVAAAERRSPVAVLREAVEFYLERRRIVATVDVPAGVSMPRGVGDAIERILARRAGHLLPVGMDIRELTTFGRA